MVYRKVELAPILNHVPAGYADTKNLVTISPKEIELWSVPSELDEYLNKIQQLLTVDFDSLTSGDLKREIVLNATQGVRLVNGSETITMKVYLSNIITRTVDVPLSADKVKLENCPEGMNVVLQQTRLPSIRICGPSSVVNRIRTSDIILSVDMSGKTAGQQIVKARLILPKDTAWIVYEDAAGIEVQVEITAEE
jgi:YbbR domain-containing protein